MCFPKLNIFHCCIGYRVNTSVFGVEILNRLTPPGERSV